MAFVGLTIAFAIGFLAFMDYKKSDEKEKMQCFVRHLKTMEDEECFNSVGEFYGEDTECDETIDAVFRESLKETEKELSNRISSWEITNCVLTNLKDQRLYQNKILLTQVLEHTKISWKFWKYFERKTRLNEVHDEIKQFEVRAEKTCTGEEDTLDTVIDSEESTEDTTEETTEETTTEEIELETTEKILETTTRRILIDDDEGYDDEGGDDISGDGSGDKVPIEVSTMRFKRSSRNEDFIFQA